MNCEHKTIYYSGTLEGYYCRDCEVAVEPPKTLTARMLCMHEMTVEEAAQLEQIMANPSRREFKILPLGDPSRLK
jgi:hypothetical protein